MVLRASVLPEPLEAVCRQLGVSHRVLNVPRLLPTRNAIYPCPERSKGRSWPCSHRNPGATGRAVKPALSRAAALKSIPSEGARPNEIRERRFRDRRDRPGALHPLPGKVACAQGLPPGQLPTLTGEWWQWALSIPNSVSPLSDATGERCMIGQRGSIWLLAGISGTGSTTRSCDVPAGATMFFPVINFVNVNTPCNQNGVNFTAKQLQAQIQPAIDSIHSVSVTVDGQDVKTTLLRLVVSDPFEAALPADNVFGPDGCSTGVPVSPGIYSPAVDGGDYVSLPPLSPGAHTIHFHGESDSTVFDHVVQDVTYNLTVVPVSLK